MASHESERRRVVHGRLCYDEKLMYYTYVLRSLRDRKLYIGFTHDLRQRFIEHQEGKVESTKPRRPFELLFYEAFQYKKDALGRERYFKTTKGKVTLRQVLRDSLLQ